MDFFFFFLSLSFSLRADTCLLPKESGTCTSSLVYFYYDDANKTCEKFRYSGCKGNANRFYTKEDCLITCDKPGKAVRQQAEAGKAMPGV